MKKDRYLFLIKSDTNDNNYYHLYDQKNNSLYYGSDKIKDATDFRSRQTIDETKYNHMIPIDEMQFEKLMRTNYIELARSSINEVLKKLKIEEYLI